MLAVMSPKRVVLIHGAATTAAVWQASAARSAVRYPHVSGFGAAARLQREPGAEVTRSSTVCTTRSWSA